MRRNLLAAFALCAMVISCSPKGGLDVIPMPNDVKVSSALCPVGSITVVDDGLQNEADFFHKDCERLGVELSGAGIQLAMDTDMAPESYELVVSRRKVTVTGGDAAGVFYGLQTLVQELQAYDGCARKGKIADSPRYGWRGYMLDESRHFFGIENARQTLDMMARYKLNKFHWHLTDNQGWRIEIKAYPELTAIGAVGSNTNPQEPAAFYTQEQIREVVAYAAERHIDVIPEIDMPGHAGSATKTYPWLSMCDTPGHKTYNPGRDEVYEFFGNVLKEVFELFPYEYFHVGGDEVTHEKWNEDPYMKSFMAEQGFTDPRQAEAAFHHRMAPVIHSYGRKIIAWDDVLSMDVKGCEDALTWWRHDRHDHLKQGIEDGYEMILCPRLPLYYDFVQIHEHKVGRKWGKYKPAGIATLKNVYDFPDSLFTILDTTAVVADAAHSEAIKGIQANLWSEVVKTTDRAEFMTYPRLGALAESAWTEPANKDYASFASRLEREYAFYDRQGIYYFDHRNPAMHPEPKL